MSLRDILLALLVVVILGANFVAVKVGVSQSPPLFLTALRFFFAAIPAVFIVKPPRVPVSLVLSFGFVVGVLQFGLLFTAVNLGMPAGLSSLVIQMQVFFTVGIACFLFGERPSLLQLTGGVAGATGIAVIGLFQAGTSSLLPLLLVLLAALCWGIANILTKAAGRVDPLSFVAWSSLVAPLPLFLLSFIFEDRAAIEALIAHPNWTFVAAVCFLAYPTTLVALPLWTGLLGRYPAPKIAPFGFLVPVAGILATHVILGEHFGVADAAGSILVLVGLILNLLGSSRRGT